jgi:hypothetical protein
VDPILCATTDLPPHTHALDTRQWRAQLGGAVGLAMIEGGNSVVDAAFLGTGTWEVEIAARRYPALASMRPLFDPDNAKIKA